MKRVVWIILSWSALLVTAQAASFDCARASTKIEKMICGDAELSRLDEDLGATYKSAMQSDKEVETIRQAQKRWMKSRNSCSDVTCLRDSYKTRMAEFELGMKTEIIEGKTNPVCSKIILNDIHHIDFRLLHALSPNLDEGRFFQNGMARVDIDNNGYSDNVVRVNFSGRRGCDSSFLAVTDDSRTQLPETPLNKVLEGLGTCGRDSQSIFILDGVVFVDVRDQDNNRTIYRIGSENATVVCQLQGSTSFSEGAEK